MTEASLTEAPKTLHDGVVRRVVSFGVVLALVVAMWLPLRLGGVSEPETALPAPDGSAQTDGPSQPPAVGLKMIASAAGTWQVRLVPDVLPSEISSPRLPDYSRSASVSPARFRGHISPPLRTFPLLI